MMSKHFKVKKSAILFFIIFVKALLVNRIYTLIVYVTPHLINNSN